MFCKHGIIYTRVHLHITLSQTREDEFDFIEGPGILNEQIQLFRHIHDEMVTQIVGFASNDILDQAVQYKHNRSISIM